jgi:hypothetical protein
MCNPGLTLAGACMPPRSCGPAVASASRPRRWWQGPITFALDDLVALATGLLQHSAIQQPEMAVAIGDGPTRAQRHGRRGDLFASDAKHLRDKLLCHHHLEQRNNGGQGKVGVVELAPRLGDHWPQSQLHEFQVRFPPPELGIGYRRQKSVCRCVNTLTPYWHFKRRRRKCLWHGGVLWRCEGCSRARAADLCAVARRLARHVRHRTDPCGLRTQDRRHEAVQSCPDSGGDRSGRHDHLDWHRFGSRGRVQGGPHREVRQGRFVGRQLGARANSGNAGRRENAMTLCPIAIAVGCRKCPIVSACPVKTVIGDYVATKPAKSEAPKPKRK